MVFATNSQTQSLEWNGRWFAYVAPPLTRFSHPTAKNSNSVLLTELRPDGSNLKILTWREYFAAELYASGA